MSGIFGITDGKTKHGIPELLGQMGKQLLHQKWFRVETFTDETLGVGVGRVGIDVFNRERQPVISEDGMLVVFLSGELYHTENLHRELRIKGFSFRDDSDSELLLRLYQDRKDNFVYALEGAFLLTILDRVEQRLFIANDRFGLFPLFYANYGGKLIFAPEMKAILCDPEFNKNLDLVALAEYMRFQHLLGDRTFFDGLKALPNASLLAYGIDTDHLSIRPYWDFSQLPRLPATLTFDDAVEEAGRLLKRSVDNLLADDFRYGIFLTAGMDSRLILGLMPLERFPVTTITFGQRNSRDEVYARRLARKFGTDHRFFEFTDGTWVKEYADLHLELTEGFHSWIHSHGISIMDSVRPLIDVNLSGFGGGELNWEKPALLHASDDSAFLYHLYRFLSQETTWPSLDDIEEKMLYSSRISPDIQGLALDSLRSELKKHDHLPYALRAASFSRFNPDRRLFQYHTVFHRSYFEERFPFCDYSYLDFIYALPPEMLFDRKLRRAVIMRYAQSVAKIPYDKDGLAITAGKPTRLVGKMIQRSESFFNRHIFPVFREYSVYYADYENWLRKELREWAENILFGERITQRDIFNSDFIASLWRRYVSGLEAHMIGKIAPLITYEMMLRRFYD